MTSSLLATDYLLPDIRDHVFPHSPVQRCVLDTLAALKSSLAFMNNSRVDAVSMTPPKDTRGTRDNTNQSKSAANFNTSKGRGLPLDSNGDLEEHSQLRSVKVNHRRSAQPGQCECLIIHPLKFMRSHQPGIY